MNAGLQTLAASAANLGWLASAAPAYLRFRHALAHPAATQARWLRAHLQRNLGSAYARAHTSTALTTYREFSRRFPIVSHAELEPWVARIQRGDHNVLGADLVTRLVPTSGSTAARKLIPFTRTLQREFNAAIGPWMFDLALRHPSVAFGSAYWSVTPPAAVAPEASVVPIGFDDDTAYVGGARAWLIAAAAAVPSSVRHLSEPMEFRRTVLRHLLQRGDLRLISIWHPSFLSLLLDTLVAEWDALLAGLGPETDPRRRRALSGADPTRPGTVWPRLRVVSCWADAHAREPAAALQRRMPRVLLQPKGLLATEAFVTLPFRGAHPLALRSHFFEFLDDSGRVHLADTLRLGQTYEVVVTTGGGLWRYRLGDRVQVTGLLARTPTLRFVARAGNVSDCCGEKLSDAFVVGVLAQLCPRAAFAMLAPETTARSWRYTLYWAGESSAQPEPQDLDRELSANPHYAACRQLGQLERARVVPIADNAYERFATAEMARGLRLGDIKPVALSPRADWAGVFPERRDRVPVATPTSHP